MKLSIKSLGVFMLFAAMFCIVHSLPAQDIEQFKGRFKSKKELTIQLPIFDKAQKLQVDIIDDYVILEGDMILGTEVGLFGEGSVAVQGSSKRWNNSTIPYTIQRNHPKAADIRRAIQHINEKTNLCVVPRTTQRDYVEFIQSSGCSSWVGKQGGRQVINIGNCSFGSIAHEILHAAGFYHEQSRTDRDRYITVNFDNIQAGKAHNFQTYAARSMSGTNLGRYDYGSIMHYPNRAFSKNGRNTITVKVPPGTSSTVIGQRIGLSSGDIAGVNAIYPVEGCNSGFITVPGVGHQGQGAGVAITNLDANRRKEMIVMAYDNPSGANTFRYRVGYNLTNTGVAQRWGGFITVPGVGHQGQGAGVAIADIDKNGKPDMVLMAYDNPRGANTFRYKIGWNLNSNGVASKWGKMVVVSGVGHEGQGAEVALADMNNNGKLDIVLMAYDNPSGANTFRYKVGYDINRSGIASRWDKMVVVSGVGHQGQGAGLAIANLKGSKRPEMVLMAYDNPRGANTFRLKVGTDLRTNGTTSNWSRTVYVTGVGHEGQGADVVLVDIDNDRKLEYILMAYDNPSGANTFRYKVMEFSTSSGIAGLRP